MDGRNARLRGRCSYTTLYNETRLSSRAIGGKLGGLDALREELLLQVAVAELPVGARAEREDLSRLGARDRVQRACRELLDHEAMESLDLGRSERGAAVGRDAPAASPPHVAGAVVRAERERVALARQRDGKLGARRRRDDVLADEALDEARLRLRLLITCERRVEAVGGRG